MDIDRAPRSAHRLVADTCGLYRRYPLLFFVLAAAVIVPYRAIVFVATGTAPYSHPSLGFPTDLLLSLIDLGLITPLVSALHVHAVAEVRGGGQPRLGPIARQGLRVLPVVAAASLISWLGIFAGMALLIAPGVYLLLRWAVVAQAAAIDHAGWKPALRRSEELTAGQFVHVFALILYVLLIATVPTFLLGFAFAQDSTTATSFLIGVGAQVLVQSFAALATALLYFDLRVRRNRSAAEAPQVGGEELLDAGARDTPRKDRLLTPRHSTEDHSLDPRHYTDEERPKGWYIDTDSPLRMRYWDATGDPPSWKGSTKTPRKVRRIWTPPRP